MSTQAKNLSSPKTRFLTGFTMVEMIVILAILTAISAVVLIDFGGFNEGAALNKDTRELAVAIRQAQNMSLAVTRINTDSGLVTPPAVGIQLTTGPSSTYFTFADLVHDNKYVSSDDALIGPNAIFDRNVKINSLTDQSGNTYALAYIVFSAPEANVFLGDANGNSIGDKLNIQLLAPSGQTKTITVRTSGQISVK